MILTWLIMYILGIFVRSLALLPKTETTVKLAMIPTEAITLDNTVITSTMVFSSNADDVEAFSNSSFGMVIMIKRTYTTFVLTATRLITK